MGEVSVGQTSTNDLPPTVSELSPIPAPINVSQHAGLVAVLGAPFPDLFSPGLASPAAGEPLSGLQNVFACEPPATAISDPLLEQQTLPKPVFAPIVVEAEADSYFTGTRSSDPIPCAIDTSIPLASPPVVKASHNLRLPSFDLLGIAAPHPDCIACKPANIMHLPESPQVSEGIGGSADLDIGPASKPAQDAGSCTAWFHGNNPQMTRRHSVNHFPLTPPDDSETAGCNSLTEATSTATPTPLIRLNDSQNTEGVATETSANSSQPAVDGLGEDLEPWVEEIVEHVVSTFSTESIEGSSFKILSHALPSPASPGHAFPSIIQALHQRLPPAPTTWINVFHAVHGRFNLADLPTSPPSTPGPAFGGQDYFTTKIFDTAVPILDYSAENTPVTSSPNLVVPPSTINAAIVERYIPPTSSNEFSGLFHLRGPSLLVDRLVELSPHDGKLVFVYPTKKGGRTFMRDYMGPILDPLLRSMVVVNGFSSDLSLNLGQMASVSDLPEFSSMQKNIDALCRQLSQAGDLVRRSQISKSKFTVIYSSKQEVQLSREHWATWFVKQEKPRIRAVIAKYFRQAKKQPADTEEIMPTNLIQEILDGVMSRAYPELGSPKQGIEVGAFVIRRSRE